MTDERYDAISDEANRAIDLRRYPDCEGIYTWLNTISETEKQEFWDRFNEVCKEAI